MGGHSKKIEFVEAFFVVFFVVLSDIGDLLGLFLFPVPALGQVIFIGAKLYSFLVWLGVQFWLIMKGERGLWFAAGSVVDMIGIPFAQTATLILTIYMANHPKIAALASMASGNPAGAVGEAEGKGAIPGAPGGEKGGTSPARRAAEEGAAGAGGEASKSSPTAVGIPGQAFGEEPDPFQKMQALTEEPVLEDAAHLNGNEVNLKKATSR